MYNHVKSKRILAKDVFVSNDTWVTGINNNDLLVGPPGGGKTRGYVIPNILHAQDSLIVADTKGNLCRLYGERLKEKGYTVMHLDFTDAANTPWGYNPLAYIRECRDSETNENGDYYSEQDIKKIAQAVCPCLNSKEPFWDQAAQMYLETILLFVMNLLPQKEHNLYEAYTFLSKMETEELLNMIEEECTSHPDSAFTRKMQMIRQNARADKMDASIKGILAQHLDVVTYSGVKRMFCMKEQVNMGAFLKGKTALFLSVSDSDRSQDALINLFYTQALQYLMAAADSRPDSRLPIPVRFILDDFSTNTVIPDFDKIISVIRSREIYVSLIIQSLSQLESLYGHAKAQTILNNCDHCLYLGGTDIQTAEYFAKKFNCQVSTVLNLPLNGLFIFERGSEPRKARKYELDSDTAYRSLMMPGKQEESGTGAEYGKEAL
ncbi:MAG: type IV secretory system conjugative DNA transfer family protein [Lachnospiraceae bacterium]|jgi:type IV secretion system protein VirD4|nr:type IV secretory system conjugative DNA transfer family protein [Lachnospiraceae bacterium]